MKKKVRIPSKAKRVFKGVIFDVYQWKQKMFDGSIETFERLKRPDTVEVIGITKDKKIIILKQKQPDRNWFLSLPGGRVDKKEIPRKSALRELKEETGYASKKIKLWNKFSGPSTIKWTIYTFIAKDCEKIGKLILDSGEKIKVKLVTFNQFLKLSDDPSFRSRELIIHLLRARLDKKVRDKFYKELFLE